MLTRQTKSTFFRNILVVMSGTVLAQVIGFALSPVISRLFTPSEFGVFGSFVSVLSIITAGVTLELYQAIQLPKEKEDAFHLFVASCLSTLGITTLCLLACFLAPRSINGLMKTSGFWALAALILGIALIGLSTSLGGWCVRIKAFKQTSVSHVIRSLSSNSMQVGFGFFGGSSPELILSYLISNILASLNLFRIFLPDLKAFLPIVRWKRIIQLAREYKDFPLFSASMSYINALSLGLPVLLLAHFYGIAVAGAYTFAIKIVQAPMGFIIGALRQVLFQKVCEIQHHGDRLMPLYLKTTATLIVISLLPILIFLFWAPQLFVWIFGAKWITAGEFARCLILWLAPMFFGVPSVLFARAMRMQRQLFFFDLVLLVFRAIALIAGGMYLSAVNTILILSLVGAFMNIIYIVIIGRKLITKEGNTSWKFNLA